MSKTTLRKRISLVVITALTAGALSIAAPTAAYGSHNAVGESNEDAATGTVNGSMMTAVTTNNTSGAAAASNLAGASALSKGLLVKDSSSGTAQTATVLAGGALSLYAEVSTAAAFSATGGSFSGATTGTAATSTLYNSANTYVVLQKLDAAAELAAVLWTAPTTVGTYTVSLSTGFAASGATSVVPTTSLTPPTLSAAMLVTVVATSAGGSYSASRSACKVDIAAEAIAYSSSSPATDTTDIFENEQAAYINFDLNDAYTQNLASGNITVTATNGALVNAEDSTSIIAGSISTDILSSAGIGDSVRVDQGTAGAPVTTTVTISFNGTTVCTKTISIRGAVAKLTVANIATQALSGTSTTGGEQWMYQKTGIYTPGQFTVVATDSAGNVVSTDSTLGSYAAASGTGVQVPAITVNRASSTANASSPLAYNFGGFSCGPDAGQSSVTIKFTTTATGAIVTSDPFVARCAGAASTYTVSLDKAAYTQGELAKATVKFLDSKGNKANNMTAIGANSWVLPYMVAVDSTITATTGASATSVTDGNGEVVYTFTVGTSTAAVAGTYTGVVEFSAPALGVKSTPTYKLSTGGDTTTNADVLKSIVALIASINKQIQALQKLILRR